MKYVISFGNRLFAKGLVAVLLCAAALTSPAADTTQWNGGGGADTNWNTAANWSAGAPTANHYAMFSTPNAEPIGVAVDDTVDVYAFKLSASRTADVTLSGTGAIQTHRNSAILTGGTGRMVFDVDVVNSSSANQTIHGNSVFRKNLNIGSDHNFNIGDSNGNTGSVTLEGNAAMTVLDTYIYAGSSLSLTGSSTLNYGEGRFRVYKENASLSVGGNSTVNGKYLDVSAGAGVTISDNARVKLTRDLTVSPTGSLVIGGNSVTDLRILTLPLSRDEGVDDGWTMDGGTVCSTNTSGYLNMPYTNAVKTISGTGTFCIYQLNFGNSTNMTFRLNGPDVYVGYHYVHASRNLAYEIGGGSTIGVWGQNVEIKNEKHRFTGSATIDTTDYIDGTTGRRITMANFYDCDGTLTVKGAGEFRLNGAMKQQDLSVTVQGGATFNAQNQYVYALKDFVLKDSAKFTTTSYIGHKDYDESVKSLTMSGDSTLSIGRYADISGDVSLSGNASAVIWNSDKKTDPLSCANLSLADNASLTVMTGTVAATSISLSGSASLSVASTVRATSLSMSGDAHLSFTAGTAFGNATFGDGNWTMDIKIPASYEAGMHPIVTGVELGDDFANHVTLAGETNGWSVGVIDGVPVLYKGTAASGIEWTGGSSTSDNWSDSANWNGGILPTATDLAAFGGIARLAPVNDSISTLSGLVFRASAGPFTLTGAGSADRLKLTANCHSRGTATPDRANILSHSGFVQTIAVPIDFPQCAYVHSDGGAEVRLTQGFNQAVDWQYFIAGGEVAIGGTCSAGKLGFRTAASGTPTTCLRLLPGCEFTLRSQGDNSFTEGTTYVGRFVIEEGAQILMQGGECSFYYGALQNVVNGTLKVEGDGRLISGPSEQYYSGSGTVYAPRALACRATASKDHYINFGGSLKLYMGGDWNTASYYHNGEKLMQNPNAPTRLRMTDGTTLGATADWTYGPASDAFNLTNEIVTASGRAAAMTGTVTVDTQDPNDATKSHTITFADPLDASAATIVKNGEGSLVFNTPSQYQLQFGSLTVNEGVVSFAVAPTFSGTLTIASGAQFRADAAVADAGWTVIATATEITGPGGATEWKTADGAYKFRIVTSGGGAQLECSKDTGVVIFFL